MVCDSEPSYLCHEINVRTDLSTSANTDQEQMTLYLSEYSVDSEDMIENIVEQDQRDIQFLFVEYAQSGLCELS